MDRAAVHTNSGPPKILNSRIRPEVEVKKVANWKRDSIVCVLLLCFYAVMFVESTGLKKVARTYPQVLIILCTIFTVALLAKSIAARRKEEARNQSAEEKRMTLTVFRDIVIICVALTVYTALIRPVGYITSSVLFMVFVLVFLRIRKWYVVAGVSLITTLFLYYMFNNLLGILLPTGILI